MCKQPPGSGQADPHTVAFVSEVAALTAAARPVREHTCARRCRLSWNPARLEAEFSSRTQWSPSIPPSIKSGATQGRCETLATRTRPAAVPLA